MTKDQFDRIGRIEDRLNEGFRSQVFAIHRALVTLSSPEYDRLRSIERAARALSIHLGPGGHLFPKERRLLEAMRTALQPMGEKSHG